MRRVSGDVGQLGKLPGSCRWGGPPGLPSSLPSGFPGPESPQEGRPGGPPHLARRCGLTMAVMAAISFAQPPAAPQIAARLTANDLKADVSFLASDELQGRATPSKELDIAAQFIAAQFRRAGLEPAGDDGYFQTAAFSSVKPNLDGLELTFEIGGRKLAVDKAAMALSQPVATSLDGALALRVAASAIASLTPDQTSGKALLIEAQRPPAAAANWAPAITVLIASQGPRAPSGRPTLRDDSAPAPPTPVVVVWDAAVRDALAAAPDAEVKVSARIPAPMAEPVKLRNVAGILRGSDPALKDTYLVMTAHYDHLGVRAGGDGDRIFNGADDDASGTASLIEISNALAALPARPKRSILFVALFGEEIGEIGSLFYVRHPLFPLAKTIADVNLEQLGRTDDSEGPKVGMFNLTGFDYTTMAHAFQKAAEDAGVRAVKDEKNSDSYFGRSDNARFADAGVPSTTVSVAYMFPDYHAVGDEWPKLDYENMAEVDCALALAAFRLADSADAPAWNAANPRTARYVKAREESHQP